MVVSKRDKRMSLAAAAALVPDGSTVALAGMGTQMTSMAMVRELIRRKARDLTLVVVVGGIGVDWLVAAGCVKKMIAPIVNLGMYGMARAYRRALESGAVAWEEYSETTLLARLGAGARGLPFQITRGTIGTDLLAHHPDTTRVIADPFTGVPVVACKALEPDVAILHMHRADKYGNAQMLPKPIWPDTEIFPRAANQVIVTVEELVDEDVIRAHPENTNLPYFGVDAVVEAPLGAHPCSLFPRYAYDDQLWSDWAAVSATPAGTTAFLQRYVLEPESHAAYLKRFVGPDVRARLLGGDIVA